jgi:hypothetical protein
MKTKQARQDLSGKRYFKERSPLQAVRLAGKPCIRVVVTHENKTAHGNSVSRILKNDSFFRSKKEKPGHPPSCHP